MHTIIAVIIRIRGKIFQNAGRNSLRSQHASTVWLHMISSGVFHRKKKMVTHLQSFGAIFVSYADSIRLDEAKRTV